MDQTWLGTNLSDTDFKGKFKIAWNEQAIFVIAHITDDKIIDIHLNPLDGYWNDDFLEIFVDLDASGGNHQYNHNAFAYHISVAGDAADIGLDSLAHLYNSNLISARKSLGNNEYLWEVKLNMYAEDYKDGQENEKVLLKAMQDFGFAIAYCDNDNSKEREHFIGSAVVEGEDKNRAWIDASIFQNYQLVK